MGVATGRCSELFRRMRERLPACAQVLDVTTEYFGVSKVCLCIYGTYCIIMRDQLFFTARPQLLIIHISGRECISYDRPVIPENQTA